MKKAIIFLIISTFLSSLLATAQVFVNKEWQQTFGNPSNKEWSKSIYTSNHEILTVGNTPISNEGDNILLTCTDINGNVVWQNNFSNGTKK